tara:strand:+ start:9957 stop:10595 length:639 start_codon:yes stop_codon:yes gene_type:complete
MSAMKSAVILSTLVPFYASTVSAQGNTTTFWPNLHFGLLECDNRLEQYGWPDPNHSGSAGWNLVGMFPVGDPRQTNAPNSTFIYTLPQGGYPYHKYEGWNSSAFFWADPGQLKDYPRGWLDIKIPASAKGMKSGIQAGTISFEQVEFNCERENTSLFLGGGIECRKSNREFCAGYTYCQLRYLCRREKWPADRSCVGSGQQAFCYPGWDLPE